MFGHQFYHETTRKYIILFGSLFNDIVITRTDDANTVVDSIKVPLSYASKDKMLTRVNADPNLDKETALVLPRMSFVFHNYTYDADRKLNTLNRVVRKDETNPNKFMTQYQAVPYNLPFSLYVYSKNNEDLTKIVEQILPFFKPDWTAKVNLIPEMDISMNISVVYKGNSTQDIPYEGALDKRRVMISTLEFDLKGYFFGPVKKTPIIKFANTHLYFGNPQDNTASDIVGQVVVTPGMFANGSPTANAELSINPLLIEVDDDWEFAVSRSGLVIME
jgi:T4-like virus Myoviridae tail sheath stabiliser